MKNATDVPPRAPTLLPGPSSAAPSFRERVYAIVRRIPAGSVATYGQVARVAGSPGASRAVGMIMKHNPYAPQVPCHRVVGSDGKLVGFSGTNGVTGKESLLKNEGVPIAQHRVVVAACQVDDALLSAGGDSSGAREDAGDRTAQLEIQQKVHT